MSPNEAEEMRTCTVEGCDKRLQAKGMCGTHYARMRRTGTTDPAPRPTPKRPTRRPSGTCSVQDCDKGAVTAKMCNAHYRASLRSESPECSMEQCARPVVALQLCDTHYRRLRRAGTTDNPPPRRGVCSIEGCEKPHAGKGWCARHWQAWYRYGDPLYPVAEKAGPRPRAKRDCDVEDCDKPLFCRGYCKKHYERWRIHGDVNTVLNPNSGNPWRNKGNYKIMRVPDHPLAQARGHVLEHRVVLYAVIGPDPHPCHWCNRMVRWDVSWPKAADALVVDHLDRDRGNNIPTNLVPSCQGCNAIRANEWRKHRVAA